MTRLSARLIKEPEINKRSPIKAVRASQETRLAKLSFPELRLLSRICVVMFIVMTTPTRVMVLLIAIYSLAFISIRVTFT